MDTGARSTTPTAELGGPGLGPQAGGLTVTAGTGLGFSLLQGRGRRCFCPQMREHGVADGGLAGVFRALQAERWAWAGAGAEPALANRSSEVFLWLWARLAAVAVRQAECF